MAFTVWNRGEWAGLRGGCESTGGGHWLKCELELLHMWDVMYSLDTHTHTGTHRVSTKNALDNNGTS